MTASLRGTLPLAMPLVSEREHACAGCLNGSCFHRQPEAARRFMREMGSGSEAPSSECAPGASAYEPAPLLSSLAPWIERGQARYRATIRRLIGLLRPELLPLLDRASGDPYLEPFVFLHFSSGRTGERLLQPFAGYTTGDGGRFETSVVTDRNGNLHLPRLGVIRTPLPEARLDLRFSEERKDPVVTRSGFPLESSFAQSHMIAETSIELCPAHTPLLDSVFVNQRGETIPVAIEHPARRMQPALDRAFRLLHRLYPELHSAFASVLRLVVIFEAGGLNSFATPAAHGAVFLNAALGDDEVFLIEDLSHQGGHVLFSAATADAPSYFEVEPEASISTFHHRLDDRSVYVLLHGVFTEALMAQTLDAALTQRVFHGRQLDELRGRLAFTMRRFAADLQTVALPGILNERGLLLLRVLLDIYVDIARRRAELVLHSDFSNQTYNFSYARYLELNPPGGTGHE